MFFLRLLPSTISPSPLSHPPLPPPLHLLTYSVPLSYINLIHLSSFLSLYCYLPTCQFQGILGKPWKLWKLWKIWNPFAPLHEKCCRYRGARWVVVPVLYLLKLTAVLYVRTVSTNLTGYILSFIDLIVVSCSDRGRQGQVPKQERRKKLSFPCFHASSVLPPFVPGLQLELATMTCACGHFGVLYLFARFLRNQ